MENTKQFFQILRAGLTGERCTLPPEVDLAALAKTAVHSGVLNLFYYGALNSGVSEEDPVMAALSQRFFAGLVQCERQQAECSRLFAAFSAAGIDFMPLKGCVLRPLYSQSDMRAMGDADVLIRMEQMEQILPALEQLGYTVPGKESDHEWIFHTDGLHLELHKRLIPSYNKDYYAYFGDGWRLAKPSADTPYRYELSKEDLLIYLFTHFAKHYRDGGIGIRHMIDLWIYRRSVEDLNMTYVQNEMEKLELWTFYKNICDTLAVWFDGAESTPLTDIVTAFVLESGIYGGREGHLVSAVLKLAQTSGTDVKTARRKKNLRRLFPPAKDIRERYPALRKCPWLLPIFWMVRMVEAVFRRDRFCQNQKEFAETSLKNVSAFEQSLEYVGLRFNFKE